MLAGEAAARAFNDLFPERDKQEKIARTLARLRDIQACDRDYCLKAALAGSWIAYLFGQMVSQLPEGDQQAAREALQPYWDM